MFYEVSLSLIVVVKPLNVIINTGRRQVGSTCTSQPGEQGSNLQFPFRHGVVPCVKAADTTDLKNLSLLGYYAVCTCK